MCVWSVRRNSSSEMPDPHPCPDPTPAMLQDPRFEKIWQVIKRWEIAVPGSFGYCGGTGNHVRAILEALDA